MDSNIWVCIATDSDTATTFYTNMLSIIYLPVCLLHTNVSSLSTLLPYLFIYQLTCIFIWGYQLNKEENNAYNPPSDGYADDLVTVIRNEYD